MCSCTAPGHDTYSSQGLSLHLSLYSSRQRDFHLVLLSKGPGEEKTNVIVKSNTGIIKREKKAKCQQYSCFLLLIMMKITNISERLGQM